MLFKLLSNGHKLILSLHQGPIGANGMNGDTGPPGPKVRLYLHNKL